MGRHAKLTQDQVKAIRGATGSSLKELARTYSVTEQTIANVIKAKGGYALRENKSVQPPADNTKTFK
jgi:Mor family transcriptional regulator